MTIGFKIENVGRVSMTNCHSRGFEVGGQLRGIDEVELSSCSISGDRLGLDAERIGEVDLVDTTFDRKPVETFDDRKLRKNLMDGVSIFSLIIGIFSFTS